MALCLLVASGYAAYQASQAGAGDGASALQNDSDIDFENKILLELLESEQEGAILQLPMTCLNWFRGDYRQVAPILQAKWNLIKKANPFLAGWLVVDPTDHHKLKLLFDPLGLDRNDDQGMFRVLDGSTAIHIDHRGPSSTQPFAAPTAGNHEKEGTTSSTNNNQSTVTTEPLLPNSESAPAEQEIEILPLTWSTPYEEATQLLRNTGIMLPTQNLLIGKHHQPLIQLTIIPDCEAPLDRFALVVSMTHALGDVPTLYKILRMLDIHQEVEMLIPERHADYPAEKRVALGDEAEEYLKIALRQPPMDMTLTRNEPTVMKVFHIRENWFHKRDKRARRSSMFANPATDFTSDAGNNASGGSVSQNSILASWFFQLNQADIAFLALSMRHRLPFLQITDRHAGNYVGTVPYTCHDYATASLIEQSIAQLRRCGVDPDHATTQQPTTLPPFRWNKSASLAVNWANLFQHKLQLLPNNNKADDADGKKCIQLSHMMLYDAELLKSAPGRLSLCYTFTSVPGDLADGDVQETVSTAEAAAKVAAELAASLDDDNVEIDAAAAEEEEEEETPPKRAGMLVLCRQSVWEQIEASGIIDEMIVS